jgi:hypothetical protein
MAFGVRICSCAQVLRELVEQLMLSHVCVTVWLPAPVKFTVCVWVWVPSSCTQRYVTGPLPVDVISAVNTNGVDDAPLTASFRGPQLAL